MKIAPAEAFYRRLAGRMASAREQGRRVLEDESGNSLVELAVLTSLVGIPLLLGSSVMATIVYDSIEVTNAAHAGAMYGMQSLSYASNTSGMTSAAQAEAADFGTALSVTPITYYACSNAVGGTQYTGSNAQSNANAACTGAGNRAVEFVQVTTSVTVTSPFRALHTSYPLSATSVMEVEP